MNIRTLSASALALSFALSFGIANAQTALTVSCSGAASTSSVAWSATATGGVSPVALLWGNGSTSTSQTIAYTPGTYSMTIQATDASSSVATSSCAATIAAPATTTATSTSTSVADQIQALLSQIAALKAQIALLIQSQFGQTSTGTSTPAVIPPGQIGKGMCISLNRDIEEGDSGDDVRSLQEVLASDPSSGFTVAPTGFFGPLTAHAMEHFQEAHGIASTTIGRVGPLTRGFFERECGDGLGDSSNSDNSASSTEDRNSNQPMIPAHGEGEHGNGNGNGDN